MMPLAVERFGAIPALTGLRFFAALMVFFSHYPIPGSSGKAAMIQNSGYAGVTFFFVLSGFIIAYNYLDKFESDVRSSTVPYLIARFSRVYPLYIFCILYAWLNTGANTPLLVYLSATQAWSDDVYVAMGLNGPAWSISVEVFLYSLFPLIIPLLKYIGVLASKNRLLIFMAVIVAAQFFLALYFSLSGKGLLESVDPGSAHRWLYRAPINRVLDFCLGISAAIYYRRYMRITAMSSRAWEVITYVAIGVIFFLMTWSLNYYSSFSWDASYALPFTLVILSLVVARQSVISRILSSPKVVLLGEASFAFYLIHTLVRGLYVVQPNVSLAQSLFHEAFFLVILTALSIGLHIAIEKPAQKFIRALSRTRSAAVVSLGEPSATTVAPIVAGQGAPTNRERPELG